MTAGPGQLVVDPTGLIVGRFAWVDPTGIYARNFGTGPVSGLVRRDMMGLNTVYLSDSSLGLLPGTEATLLTSCDMWVVNAGAAVTYTPGASAVLKAYANLTTGVVSFAATGATVAGAVETKWFLSGLAQGGTGARERTRQDFQSRSGGDRACRLITLIFAPAVRWSNVGFTSVTAVCVLGAPVRSMTPSLTR